MLYCLVSVRCEATYVILWCEKYYSVYGAGIGGVFTFLKQKKLRFDPHASVPVPVPIEWLISCGQIHHSSYSARNGVII